MLRIERADKNWWIVGFVWSAEALLPALVKA